MASRTEELERGGARSLGSGGNAPFVKWGNTPCWVEGVMDSIWTGRYGDNARLHVVGCSEGLQAKADKESPAVLVEPGMDVNIGLNYTALEGVTARHVHATVHIAFEGWAESRQGQQYRAFKVFEVEAAPEKPEASSDEEPPPPDDTDYEAWSSPVAGEDDLPFLMARSVERWWESDDEF